MPAAIEPAPAGVAQQASYAGKYTKTGEALPVFSVDSGHFGLLDTLSGFTSRRNHWPACKFEEIILSASHASRSPQWIRYTGKA